MAIGINGMGRIGRLTLRAAMGAAIIAPLLLGWLFAGDTKD